MSKSLSLQLRSLKTGVRLERDRAERKFKSVRYSETIKRDVAAFINSHNLYPYELAIELGLAHDTVRRWVKQYT